MITTIPVMSSKTITDEGISVVDYGRDDYASAWIFAEGVQWVGGVMVQCFSPSVALTHPQLALSAVHQKAAATYESTIGGVPEGMRILLAPIGMRVRDIRRLLKRLL